MTRIDFCRALLASSTDRPSTASSTIGELLRAQFAVVVQRQSDQWVRAAANEQEIASIELDCLVGTEGYDEWVAEVWNVPEQRRLSYSVRIEVSLGEAASAEALFRRV